MTNSTELKLKRLGDVLADYEAKAADSPPPPKNGGKDKEKGKGKNRPLPPWLKNGEDASDASDESSDEDKPKKKPGKGNVPPPPNGGKGTKVAKPGSGFRPKQTERGTSSGRAPAVRARRRKPGVEVQPIAWRGRGEKAARGAARITTWGPTNQHVDIRRHRGDGVMDQGPSDPRLRRASQEQDTDAFRPRRGSAGGNGVTRGNSGTTIQQNPPGNLHKRRARNDSWRPSGEMGEGRRGHSGSAIVGNRPPNLRKDLWSYDPSEVKAALDVVQKALTGLANDLES